ncbi:MAG: Flp family type IVb pilin [Actinobacteria bacterium]|nr:MAG: Flp family type IVb pilin [Actinomycetota bacterium]
MLELFNKAFNKAFLTLRNREEGQAMVEYALILGLVSVVAIAALTAIGTNVNLIFQNIRDSLAGAL